MTISSENMWTIKAVCQVSMIWMPWIQPQQFQTQIFRSAGETWKPIALTAAVSQQECQEPDRVRNSLLEPPNLTYMESQEGLV